jgi:hypothetical protein
MDGGEIAITTGIDHSLEDQVSDYLLTSVHQVHMHQFLSHLTLQVASHRLRFYTHQVLGTIVLMVCWSPLKLAVAFLLLVPMPLLLCESDALETFSEERATHLVAWEINHLYLNIFSDSCM